MGQPVQMVMVMTDITTYKTGRDGRIDRVRASCAEGREFKSQSSQATDLHYKIDTYLFLASRLALLG